MAEHLPEPTAPSAAALRAARRPRWRERFVVLRYFAEFLPVVLGTALFFALWSAREAGRPLRTAADWARLAGGTLVLAVVLAGGFLLLLFVARLLGMRSEEEWAAERTPARVSAHRWRMAVVWALLAIAALVTWLAPEYH